MRFLNNGKVFSPCPDNDVGELLKTKGKCTGRLYFTEEHRRELARKAAIDRPAEAGEGRTSDKNLVIILESPHKREYADEQFIAPALGKTGENLQQYFCDICQSFLPEGSYRVILMNAVSYPCSECEPPRCYRDKNWCRLWFNENGKADFQERLCSCRPDILFNACTLGGHGKGMEKPDIAYL